MGLWSWSDSAPRWSFVVDTDSYAGNFERQLASYIVGRCDDHGDHMGGPFREMYEKELPDDPFLDLVEERISDPGDDGIHHAPMDLAPTPGFENTGNGEVLPLKPGKNPKYPAYNSVAIFLSRRPTKNELAMLVARAQKFVTLSPVNRWDHWPKILGMRLVEERTEIISHDLMAVQ